MYCDQRNINILWYNDANSGVLTISEMF